MAVTVKSEKQIALMREAGRLLAITHEELHKALKPGMTTLDIDRLGEELFSQSVNIKCCHSRF